MPSSRCPSAREQGRPCRAPPSGRESCQRGMWAGIVPGVATDPAQIEAATVTTAVAPIVAPVAARRDWWLPASGAILLGAAAARGDGRAGRPGLVAGAARPARPVAARRGRQRSQRRRVERDLADPHATGRAGRCRRGDAVARRGELSGRVPQPARRPLPARGRGRGRARSDDRVHRRPLGDGRLAGRSCADVRLRGRPGDGARDLHRRCRLRRHPVRGRHSCSPGWR